MDIQTKISTLASSLADLDRLQFSALDACNEDVLHSPVITLLPLRFCRHAIREMLFDATARPPSIPHKLLRTLGLAEPTEFSLGFLADFRPAIHQTKAALIDRLPPSIPFR